MKTLRALWKIGDWHCMALLWPPWRLNRDNRKICSFDKFLYTAAKNIFVFPLLLVWPRMRFLVDTLQATWRRLVWKSPLQMIIVFSANVCSRLVYGYYQQHAWIDCWLIKHRCTIQNQSNTVKGHLHSDQMGVYLIPNKSQTLNLLTPTHLFLIHIATFLAIFFSFSFRYYCWSAASACS